MSHRGAVFLICMAALSLATPASAFTAAETAAARTVIADIDHGKWDDAYSVADRAQFPLLTKLVTWFDLTRSGTVQDFQHYSGFITENPDWPQQTLLRKHDEDVINDTVPASQVITWFQRFAPLGANGAGHYIDALNATNQHAQAESTARQFLVDGTMTSSQLSEFGGRYQPMLRQVDFELRADRLVWSGNADDAAALAPYLSANARAVLQARIAFMNQSSAAMSLFQQLSKDQQNDLGLLYDRMRWLRKQNRDAEAIELLAIAPPTLPHADLWWNERAVLARRALESGDAKTGYALARDHRQASGSALADG